MGTDDDLTDSGKSTTPGSPPNGEAGGQAPDVRFGKISQRGVDVSRKLTGEGHHLARGDRTNYLGIGFRVTAQPREHEKLAPLDHQGPPMSPAEPKAPVPSVAASPPDTNRSTPSAAPEPNGVWRRVLDLFGRQS